MICSGLLRVRFRMNGQILVVIASAAKQSREVSDALDCRVASLLAMTEGLFAPIITFSPSFSKEGLGWFLSSERRPCVFIPSSPFHRFSLTRAMLSHLHHPKPVPGETAPGRFRSVRGTDRPETSEEEGLTPLPFVLSLSKDSARSIEVLRQAQDERGCNHHHLPPLMVEPFDCLLWQALRTGQGRDTGS
jgi:hypothetical protein